MIIEKYKPDVWRFSSLRLLIDNQFEMTKKYFLIQTIIYVIFYLIPIWLQIFIIQDTSTRVALVTICFITQFGFFVLEMIQMKYSGMKEYFRDL